LVADLSERSADDSQISSNSSISLVQFCVGNPHPRPLSISWQRGEKPNTESHLSSQSSVSELPEDKPSVKMNKAPQGDYNHLKVTVKARSGHVCGGGGGMGPFDAVVVAVEKVGFYAAIRQGFKPLPELKKGAEAH
jgi:hypothetical protein